MIKEKKAKRPSILKQLLNSKSGIAGLVMIAILIILTFYATFALSPSLPFQWNNGNVWVLNPSAAPPSWIGVFGINNAPTLSINFSNWATTIVPYGDLSYYVYSSSISFKWSSNEYPQNIAFVPQFSGNASTDQITWTKPSGSSSLVISISDPTSGRAYEASDHDVSGAATQYLYNQTSQYYNQPSESVVVKSFFGSPGKGILNSSVEQGTYKVTSQVVSTEPLKLSGSPVVIIGNYYGLMGTDYAGRPIDLGLLAGLPNALEIGFLVSIVAVIWGILFGGIAGYLGGKKDGVMQWANLVVLAMPALPFLVVMSFVTKLNVIVEVLLIAALSWPFYAIIARTVALSIKSQTFVEADKAMGIPAYRVFFSHFMPRLVPVTIAYTVLGIPAGILLAETLAFLNIVPGNIITWGGILNDAFNYHAALFGWWWWVVFPGLMIVIAAIPFVLMGFALEKIIAPRVAAK